MALIKCPECGKEISDRSQTCIQCGFPLSKMIYIKVTDTIKEERNETVKVTLEPITNQKEQKPDRSQGIITVSNDKDIAKSYWNMGVGEVMAVQACKIKKMGQKQFFKPYMKGDWYIAMTNQRFIISNASNNGIKWGAAAMSAMGFGALPILISGAVGEALTKGIPVYVIPFEYIDHAEADENQKQLIIRTKDGVRYTYEMSKRDVKMFQKQIATLF